MKKFGLIGCGKMASALVQGMLNANVCSKSDVIAADIVSTSAETLAKTYGIQSAKNNRQVAESADTILLCVKPQDAINALKEMRDKLSGKLVISIVAGLPIAQLQSVAGVGVRIIRVMPNTPALVQKGATAFALGSNTSPADAATANAIFSAVGIAYEVPEKSLDAVTGLSGSGPAYLYLIIEAMADGAVQMGLPRDLAIHLAAQTVSGAAEMVLQTQQHPAQLKDMVASPGGTTIAGIHTLEKFGVRAGIMAAVEAATKRSQEIGKS